jgi:outer membrane lipoprotein carrier protein
LGAAQLALTRFQALARQRFVSLNRLIPCLLAVSAFGADTKLNELLQRVEDRYNNAKTLQVLFMEQYTPPGSIRRTESGELTLRKPGRMRWDYSKPKGKLWISDGKYIWMYSPADNRAERMKFKESEDMRAPLAFLLGKLHFDKEFRNLQVQADGAGTRITAEPKGENLPYSSVEFVVTPLNQIREVKVTGFDRSIYDFTFDQEKLDPPLSPTLFRFQTPPGVTLEETAQ